MKTAFTDPVGVAHPIVGLNRSPGVVADPDRQARPAAAQRVA